MKKRNCIPLVLLCSLVFTGFTPRPVKQEVEVKIFLPWRGNHNYWNIYFYDSDGRIVYDFQTNDNTFNSQVLGNIEVGEYRVEFESNYSGEIFDFAVCAPSVCDYNMDQEDHTYYHAIIEPETNIIIDHVEF